MAATFYKTFENKAILIPRLQRDYVQGLNVALMSNFIERLINAVITGKNVDLNYIYGRWVENGQEYIPIDGQQRLTTLWLLHLYAHSASQDSVFPIDIIFESREYAHNICACLKSKLGEILKNYSNGHICKHITNQAWFKRIWYKDRTVKSFLSALDIIESKLNNTDIQSFYEDLKSKDAITFKFYKIDGKLNDDVYIKMNGRGLPLTDYELLKSWMDGKLEKYCGNKRGWLQQWQHKIDNDWTELIWKNRCLGERDSMGRDISFLIDDEFLRLFYNLIIIYWSLLKANHHKKADICGQVDEAVDPDNQIIEDIARILNMEGLVESDEFPEKVYETLLERFRSKGEYYLPLYLLDKTNIFTSRLFIFIFTAFEELVKSSKSQEKKWLFEKNENELNLHVGANENKTILHQIALEENRSYSDLCLFYASIKPISTEEGSATSYFDWMRVMRNLILGSDIDKNNFSRVLNSIHDFSASCIETNIYELIRNGTLEKESSGFKGEQIREEVEKAKWILMDRDWVSLFNSLENTSFCKGTIGFIFHYLPTQKDKQVFKEYSSLFRLIFGKSGVRNSIPDYLLQRSLMCYTSHYGFGYSFGDGDKWKFMDNREEWHKFLIDSEIYDGQSHNQCMKSLLSRLYEGLHNHIDLSNYCEEYASALNCELDAITKQALNDKIIKDWRYFFIKYPSIWSVMSRSICLWRDDYDIVILGSTQFRAGNIRELRSFAFYNDIIEDLKLNPEDYKDWESPGFWRNDVTCMFIKRQCATERTIEINLFYERGKADQYRFKIFYKTNSFEESEVTYRATQEDFRLISERHHFEFQNEDHRYYSPYYSYSDAKGVFKDLIREFAKY